MATTTLMPLDPALSPQRVNRVLTINADLLPEEIVAGRRARRTRAWVLAVVAVVLVALGGWYLRADRETTLANEELENATGQQIALQRQQAAYAEVVNVQSDTETIAKQLHTLLANDMPWATLLDTLRTIGERSGVAVDGINGSLTDPATGAGSSSETADLPSTSGSATIGTLTIAGTAPDKPTVARYVDALGTLSTVANPYVTSVAKSQDTRFTFSLSVDITSEALCGRYTTKCTSSGGN
jgi:Tfp pilus assembly protein PilN